MDRFLRGIVVTMLGIATTVLTAVGLVYLEVHYDCAIYGFVLAFIFPFGAVLSGFLAASGYLPGSRLLNYRPGRGLLVTMLAVSGANFFLIYWLKYIHLQVNGEPVRNWMGFSSYLRFTLTHTAMKAGHFSSDSFELGAGGYLYAALLILGFAGGGYFMFNLTRSEPYCEDCSVYMKKQGSQTRYFVKWEEVAACTSEIRRECEGGQFRKAVQVHARAGAHDADAATGYSVGLEFKNCKKCEKQWVEMIAKKRANGRWSRDFNVKYSAYCSERVEVLEKLAVHG